MSRKSLQRLKQIAKPDDYDDTLSAGDIANSETNANDFADALNAIFSQLKRFIHGNHAGNWFDDPASVFGRDASLFSLLTKKLDGNAVSGQIDGTSPPAAGTFGRVFIVTTAGGAYSLKELWLDNGTSWEQIPIVDGYVITPTIDLLGGTDEYQGGYIYHWDQSTLQWISMGTSGGAVTALAKDYIAVGETLTIPLYYQHIVTTNITVDGEIEVIGTLAVL